MSKVRGELRKSSLLKWSILKPGPNRLQGTRRPKVKKNFEKDRPLPTYIPKYTILCPTDYPFFSPSSPCFYSISLSFFFGPVMLAPGHGSCVHQRCSFFYGIYKLIFRKPELADFVYTKLLILANWIETCFVDKLIGFEVIRARTRYRRVFVARIIRLMEGGVRLFGHDFMLESLLRNKFKSNGYLDYCKSSYLKKRYCKRNVLKKYSKI